MHNDIINAFASRTCIVGVVVFPQSRKFLKMAVMLTCVLMWLGRPVAAWVICWSFQIGQMKLLFYYFPPLLALLATILDLSLTTTPILPLAVLRHHT